MPRRKAGRSLIKRLQRLLRTTRRQFRAAERQQLRSGLRQKRARVIKQRRPAMMLSELFPSADFVH
jgi:hypothetical protein